MSNPTSNFGWQMPTPVDLVTDLPADFEVFGQAVDSSLADLKGGTSGQILSKNSNTDMDFVWITNDVGDITAVTAGTGLTGGGTSGAVSLAFDIANNGGGQFAAGKNGLINGAMEVAQRGTAAITLTAAAFSYPLDRWFAARNSGTSGATAQQISSIGLTGFNNALRIQRTAGDTSTTRLYMGQSFETVNSIPFAGQAVTLSFYARGGANLSSALAVRLITGTGTDQGGLGTSWTGTATPISQSQSLTTTWTRYQFTATLASTATQIQAFFFIDPTGTAGAADSFDITGLQLELGAIASPFRRSAGNYQGELAACQRYYYRFTPTAAANRYGVGFCDSSTVGEIYTNFPVQMRTRPTALEQSGTAADYSLRTPAAGVINCSAVPQIGNASEWGSTTNLTVASGLTAGNGTLGRAVNTSAYLGWSAEL